MKAILLVDVDEEKIQEIIDSEDFEVETVEDAIRQEMGWVAQSGIYYCRAIVQKPNMESHEFFAHIVSELTDIVK